MQGKRQCGIFSSEVKSCQEMTADEIGLWKKTTSEKSEYHSAFYTYSFFAAVSVVYQDAYVSIIRKAGKIVCFFPFQLMKGMGRFCLAGERIGEEMSDYFAPIYTTDVLISPDQFLKLTGLHYFYFTHLEQYFIEQKGMDASQGEIGLRVNFKKSDQDYFDYLREKHKSLYPDTKRREKKAIQDKGEMTFVFQSRDENDYAFLVAKKNAQYERTKRVGYFRKERTELLDYLFKHENDEFQTTLSTISFGGNLMAAHLGMFYQGVLHYWFPVYDFECQKYSPGRLLLCKIIETAGENEVEVIDRGSGDTPYKRDFSNEEHYFYKGAWSQASIKGTLFSLKQSLEWRLQTNG
ncbi:MAG: GNAT family N-acetyltransferase [Alphaproteobacteria bacterium]|nr:GNAT family N-acetyltransferase [Alphaproteobacteria bacterium]MBP9877563.1 GNAT family N-acetyltransferase [Alphaproteobacteria bacterium]